MHENIEQMGICFWDDAIEDVNKREIRCTLAFYHFLGWKGIRPKELR